MLQQQSQHFIFSLYNTSTLQFQTGPETDDPNSIQKAADFIQAFVYGFDVNDCLALVRLDDLYLETFDIKDGKCGDVESAFSYLDLWINGMIRSFEYLELYDYKKINR